VSTYLRVLRHPNFRYLFAGQAASMTGDHVVVVALALYITQRTGSPTDLGIVLGVQGMALVTLLLFGGVWADRLPRQRIMIAADSVRAILHALLAALILTGAARVWEIAAIEGLFGAAMAFFQPAYSGLLPETVPEAEVQDARALTETAGNVAFVVGPALATALVLGVGAGEAFAIDAATFVLSAFLLMRVHPRVRGTRAEAEPALEALRSGWREVRSRRWVLAVIGAFTVGVFCVYAPWYSLAPAIARDYYGGAGVFGLLEALVGVGAVCGGLTGLIWRPVRPLRAGLLLMMAWPVLTGSFALRAPLALVAVCALATGAGFSLLMIWWETALVRNIPPGALSRVSSWDWMGSLALMPIGYLVAGPLASVLGLRLVLGLGSILGVAALGAALMQRSTRELRDDSAEHFARDVGVEASGEAEVSHVDSLIGVVDEGR
jgi:MFS family permease